MYTYLCIYRYRDREREISRQNIRIASGKYLQFPVLGKVKDDFSQTEDHREKVGGVCGGAACLSPPS